LRSVVSPSFGSMLKIGWETEGSNAAMFAVVRSLL
jgi:hypothetical protein